METPRLLQGLRLNCWLAGMLPAVVLAGLALIIGQQVEASQRQQIADGARRALKSYVAGGGGERPMENLLLSDHWWQGAQRLAIAPAGEVTIEAEVGAISADHDLPPPQLVQAVTEARSWWDAQGFVRVAAPISAPDGAFEALLYAELRPTKMPSKGWFAVAASILLVIGALMAWYLARRVYGPVDALCEQAEAALSGRSLPPQTRSMETKALASAVTALADAYVQGKEAQLSALPESRKAVGTVQTVQTQRGQDAVPDDAANSDEANSDKAKADD